MKKIAEGILLEEREAKEIKKLLSILGELLDEADWEKGLPVEICEVLKYTAAFYQL